MIKVSHNPDVLSCLANLSNDEVFTPPRLVNQMLDTLPASLWSDKSVTFLDPFTKSGVFLREIAKRLIEGLADEIPDQQERINHIFQNQLFGIAITELTSLLARRSLYCSKYANGKYSIVEGFESEEGNIKYSRIEHTWKNGKCIYCGASESEYDRDDSLETYAYEFIHTEKPNKIFNMKFDVIIGNPPYQLSDGGAQSSAIPIYQKFVEVAKKLNPSHLTMIIPSRWFAGGRGLNKFRESMLNDRRIRELHDYISSKDCFPGVEIKGGVCFFYWEKSYNGKCYVNTYENNQLVSSSKRFLENDFSKIFIRYNDSVSILEKVISKNHVPISNWMSSQKPFGLRTFYKGKPNSFKNSIKVYINKGIGFASENEVSINENWIGKHKIIIPRAIGSGDSRVDLIKPIYSEPGSCCSETYIVLGPFKSKDYADNVIEYIKTKFFHFLVTLQKNTMMAPKSVYSFVPIQDFSEKWTDEKLYAKYGITEEEQKFIDTLIRPLD